MKHRFKYYLHDGYEEDETLEFVRDQLPGVDLSRFPRRPFYEITLACEFDDETGAVTVLGVKL